MKLNLINAVIVFIVGYFFLFISSGDINIVCLVSEGNFLTGQERCVGLLSIFSQGIKTVGFILLTVTSIISSISFK